jgi:hypothetical protein
MMTHWNVETPIGEVIAEIEAMDDDEVVLLAAPYGLAARARARVLGDVRALDDALRRRGHTPIVEVHHTPDGEAFAISIDRDAR